MAPPSTTVCALLLGVVCLFGITSAVVLECYTGKGDAVDTSKICNTDDTDTAGCYKAVTNSAVDRGCSNDCVGSKSDKLRVYCCHNLDDCNGANYLAVVSPLTLTGSVLSALILAVLRQ